MKRLIKIITLIGASCGVVAAIINIYLLISGNGNKFLHLAVALCSVCCVIIILVNYFAQRGKNK